MRLLIILFLLPIAVRAQNLEFQSVQKISSDSVIVKLKPVFLVADGIAYKKTSLIKCHKEVKEATLIKLNYYMRRLDGETFISSDTINLNYIDRRRLINFIKVNDIKN